MKLIYKHLQELFFLPSPRVPAFYSQLQYLLKHEDLVESFNPSLPSDKLKNYLTGHACVYACASVYIQRDAEQLTKIANNAVGN